MTDNLIEAVARAIRDELFDGTENKPPVGAETPAHGMARAAIAAIEASGTHRVVPMVPTELMVDGFIGDLIGTQTFMERYTAMINAAPKVVP